MNPLQQGNKFYYEKIPVEIITFWKSNIDGSLLLLTDSAEKPPYRFAFVDRTEELVSGSGNNSTLKYLAQGWISADGHAYVQYFHGRKNYSENEYLSLIKMKAFW